MVDLDNLDPDTLRLLVIPGGGTKGYGSNHFMYRLAQNYGIPEGEIWKIFDVIGGTSIGGILTCGYAHGLPPSDLAGIFENDAQWIFTNDAGTPSSRPSTFQKALDIGFDNAPFYTSNPGDTYGPARLQTVLSNNFGNTKLYELKTHVVVPALLLNPRRKVTFSSLTYPPYFESASASVVDVCRATSAAPIYLPPYMFPGTLDTYRDGGVFANDPVLAVIMAGLMIKPNAKNIVIASVGAGVGHTGFDSQDVTADKQAIILFKLLNDVLADTEAWAANWLRFLSDWSGKNFYYYKFQPEFPQSFNNELDMSTSDWLLSLKGIVNNLFDGAAAADIEQLQTKLFR